MAKVNSKTVDYQALNEELENIITDMQLDNGDVDSSMKQYERGLSIVKQLEVYLSDAENTVKQLKAKFDTAK